MKTTHHLISNGDGWHLSLYQSWDEERLVPGRRPVLIVPGYGMNSFIFSFHPRGLSMEGWLAEAGFEVWRVDLRAQGGSVSIGGDDDFSLEDLALTDLGAAIEAALERSRTGADKVDVIGASLGGTLMFLHAVGNPDHRIGSMVAMGSPVRWVSVHPLLKLAFSAPDLVGLVRMRGTRKLAELALPLIVRHTPWLLSVYMNPGITDMTAAGEMVKTVEDPNRYINREIAWWIKRGDLFVRGRNVSESLGALEMPFLCVLANQDGIVPRETALFPFEKVGSRVRGIIEVGERTMAMAHADLFVSNEAHERVFRPISVWLAQQSAAVAA